jgi:lysophospholipase L1-like esterase
MHRAASLPDLIVGTAVAAVATTSSLGALEALLRTHWVAATLGTPQEINAWAYKRADQLWRRNIFRFRSTHETVARRAGVKRVFVAGDSYTFGDKVAETDSTWPARLERKFNQAHPEQRFEVINSAFVGYTTANEAELLRRLGWQFNPDLVVVQFYTNDALPSTPGLQHGGDDMFDPRTPLLPRRFRTGAVQSSALLFVVERKVAALTAPSAVRDAIIHSFDEGSSRARGTPVVFMMFPTFFEGEHTAASYPFRSIVDKVSAVATQAGFDVLDLTSAFAAEGGDWKRWWVTPYDAHPSSAAHEVAARALISHLEQRGWPASEPLPASSVQPVHHVVTD